MVAHDGEYLFPGDNGEPVTDNTLGEMVRGKSDRVGVLEFMGWHRDPAKKWTPYALRRTAATLLGKRGYTDEDIKVLLDHKKKNDVGRYNKAGDAYERAKVELQQVLEEQLQACLLSPVQLAA